LEGRILESGPSQLRCTQRSTTNTVQHHKGYYNTDRFDTSRSSKDLRGASLLCRLEHHDVGLARLLRAWCNPSLKLLRSQVSQGDLDTDMGSFIENPVPARPAPHVSHYPAESAIRLTWWLKPQRKPAQKPRQAEIGGPSCAATRYIDQLVKSHDFQLNLARLCVRRTRSPAHVVARPRQHCIQAPMITGKRRPATLSQSMSPKNTAVAFHLCARSSSRG
jgi:hypothetical protein